MCERRDDGHEPWGGAKAVRRALPPPRPPHPPRPPPPPPIIPCLRRPSLRRQWHLPGRLCYLLLLPVFFLRSAASRRSNVGWLLCVATERLVYCQAIGGRPPFHRPLLRPSSLVSLCLMTFFFFFFFKLVLLLWIGLWRRGLLIGLVLWRSCCMPPLLLLLGK